MKILIIYYSFLFASLLISLCHGFGTHVPSRSLAIKSRVVPVQFTRQSIRESKVRLEAGSNGNKEVAAGAILGLLTAGPFGTCSKNCGPSLSPWVA